MNGHDMGAGSGARRGRRRAAAVPLAGLLLLLGACGTSTAQKGTTSTASSGGATAGQVEATITGHLSTTSTTTQNGGTVVMSDTLDWKVSVSGSEQDFKNGTPVAKILSMTGTVSWHSSSPALSCTGNLSAAPHLFDSTLNDLLSVEPPGDPNTALHGEFGYGPMNNAGSQQWLLEGSIPDNHTVVSDNTDPSQSQCNTPVAADFLWNGPDKGSPLYHAWLAVFTPFALFSADGHSDNATATFNQTFPSSSPPGSTVSNTNDESETFTFHT